MLPSLVATSAFVGGIPVPEAEATVRSFRFATDDLPEPQRDLALALQRRAAAGQIYGEEQLVTRGLLLRARCLTQSRERAAEHADAGQELLGDVDVRHPAG